MTGPCERLLALLMAGSRDELEAQWAASTPVDHAAVLSRLAWDARHATRPHPATHIPSRMASWWTLDAATWDTSAGPWRGLETEVYRSTSADVLETALLLVEAARTGALPASPQRCGGCGTEREPLHLWFESGVNWPGWHRLHCQDCLKQLSLDAAEGGQ